MPPRKKRVRVVKAARNKYPHASAKAQLVNIINVERALRRRRVKKRVQPRAPTEYPNLSAIAYFDAMNKLSQQRPPGATGYKEQEQEQVAIPAPARAPPMSRSLAQFMQRQSIVPAQAVPVAMDDEDDEIVVGVSGDVRHPAPPALARPRALKRSKSAPNVAKQSAPSSSVPAEQAKVVARQIQEALRRRDPQGTIARLKRLYRSATKRSLPADAVNKANAGEPADLIVLMAKSPEVRDKYAKLQAAAQSMHPKAKVGVSRTLEHWEANASDVSSDGNGKDELSRVPPLEAVDESGYAADPFEEGAGAGPGGLTNEELEHIVDRYCPRLRRIFGGVIHESNLAKQQVPSLPIAFVVHRPFPGDASNGHWVALYISKDSVEYFDSYAKDPSAVFMRGLRKMLRNNDLEACPLKLKVNGLKQQSVASDTCGLYVIDFSNNRARLRDLHGAFSIASGFSEFVRAAMRAGVSPVADGEARVNRLKREFKLL